MALACSSSAQERRVGLERPSAFAFRAYSSVSAAMPKVKPVASAYPACSFEAKLKVVHPATAKESPSSCRACSSPFAEEKAAVPRIFWGTTTAERACSSPACYPSDFCLRSSFASVSSSFLMLAFVDASRTSSFRACSFPSCCPSHVFSRSGSCALLFSFAAMSPLS